MKVKQQGISFKGSILICCFCFMGTFFLGLIFMGVFFDYIVNLDVLNMICLLIVFSLINAAIVGLLTLVPIEILKTELDEANTIVDNICENMFTHVQDEGSNLECDQLLKSVNCLSDEVQNSLANYKDSIDAFIHEVKTPLTVIIGYANIMQYTHFEDEQLNECVEYILTESLRLNTLTKRIIYFLSISNHKVVEELSSIDSLIEASILSTRVTANTKNIEVIYEKTEKGYLFGDAELLITCIVNLIENAIKASHKNDKVHINVSLTENAVSRIQVSDHGIGISKSEINKIFLPFYMIHKKKSLVDNGIGLGLATCQTIITAHNGSITVSSDLGVGTDININLPSDDYISKFKKQNKTLGEDVQAIPHLP